MCRKDENGQKVSKWLLRLAVETGKFVENRIVGKTKIASEEVY